MKKKYILLPIIIITAMFSVQGQNKIKKLPEKKLRKTPVILNSKPKTKEELQKEVEELKAALEDLKQKVDKLDERTDPQNKLKISGVFDVNVSNFQNKPNIFDIGNFELYLEHNYKNHFQVAAALVFNNRGAELGVGFIDYHIFGGSISPRGRLFAEKGVHIQVGKFDIPFGNDWQYYASSSRITVTPPMTTEDLMEGGYNDVGMRLLGNFVWINFTAYVLRGIDAAYSWGGNSIGARVGFTPFSNPYSLKSKSRQILEFGVSYIQDFDKGGRTAEMLVAADIEGKVGPVIMRSEYYWRDKKVGVIHDGAHALIGLDLETISPAPLILFFRYGYYRITYYKGISTQNWLHRITSGLNINISHISYIKLEYIRYLEYFNDYMVPAYFNENLFFSQLVITF